MIKEWRRLCELMRLVMTARRAKRSTMQSAIQEILDWAASSAGMTTATAAATAPTTSVDQIRYKAR